MTLTKRDLVVRIGEETGKIQFEIHEIIQKTLDYIAEALARGDKVELRGFGSFKVKRRRSRLARNPRTGDAVDVPAKRVPYFKASNELKDRLNGPA